MIILQTQPVCDNRGQHISELFDEHHIIILNNPQFVSDVFTVI